MMAGSTLKRPVQGLLGSLQSLKRSVSRLVRKQGATFGGRGSRRRFRYTKQCFANTLTMTMVAREDGGDGLLGTEFEEFAKANGFHSSLHLWIQSTTLDNAIKLHCTKYIPVLTHYIDPLQPLHDTPIPFALQGHYLYFYACHLATDVLSSDIPLSAHAKMAAENVMTPSATLYVFHELMMEVLDGMYRDGFARFVRMKTGSKENRVGFGDWKPPVPPKDLERTRSVGTLFEEPALSRSPSIATVVVKDLPPQPPAKPTQTATSTELPPPPAKPTQTATITELPPPPPANPIPDDRPLPPLPSKPSLPSLITHPQQPHRAPSASSLSTLASSLWVERASLAASDHPPPDSPPRRTHSLTTKKSNINLKMDTLRRGSSLKLARKASMASMGVGNGGDADSAVECGSPPRDRVVPVAVA